MKRRDYSTGSPQLDKYLGDILPGDAILCILHRQRDVMPLIKNVVAHCQQADIPIVSLLAENSYYSQFCSLYSAASYKAFEDRNRRSGYQTIVKRFLSNIAKRSYILIDDLSNWKRILGSEKELVKFFKMLVDVTASKKALFIASVQRVDLSHNTIVQLKDLSPVTLEVIEREGKLYCVPLSVVHRYVPYRLFPLELKTGRGKRTDYEHALALTPEQYPSSRLPARQMSGWRRDDKLFKKIGEDVFSSDERYRRIFQNANEPLMLFNVKDGYREVNQAVAELTGYSRDELATLSLSRIIPPEYKHIVLRTVASLKHKQRQFLRMSIIKKNGRSVPVEISFSPMGDGWFLCMLSDLSKRYVEQELRKQVESSTLRESNFRSILDASAITVAVIVGNRIAHANIAFVKLFNYSILEEVHSRNIFDFFVPESAGELKRFIKNLKETQSDIKHDTQKVDPVNGVELIGVKQGGIKFVCDCRLTNTVFYGKAAIQFVLDDVTERKNYVDSLRKTTDRYLTLIQESSEAISIVGNNQIIYATPAFLRMFGYADMQEILNCNVEMVFQPKQKDDISNKLEQLQKTHGRQEKYQVRALRKDATDFESEIHVRQIAFDGKSAVMVSWFDITKEKDFQNQLQNMVEVNEFLDKFTASLSESAEVSPLLQKALHLLLQDLSFKSGGVLTLDRSETEFHLVYDENLPERMVSTFSVLPREEGFTGMLVKTQEPHQFTVSEYPSYLPYRSLFIDLKVHAITLIPLIVKEKVNGILLLLSGEKSGNFDQHRYMFSVIGKQLGVMIENANRLREIEQLLAQQRTLVESLSDVIYSRTPEGNFMYISPKIENIVGYKQKDFYRNRSLWLSIVHPDDKKDILIQLANLHNLQSNFVNEYRVLPKGKAEYRWVRDSVTLIRDETNSVVKVHGILSEIVESKRFDKEVNEQTISA